MKQYRITSANFVHQGETGDADAVMDAKDLAEIKKLAGLPITEGEGSGSPSWGGVVGQFNVPLAQDSGIVSPVGSTMNKSVQDRDALLAEYNVQTGTDLWFIIMFTKPHLTGSSLRDQVEAYLTKHPEYRPRPLPGQ